MYGGEVRTREEAEAVRKELLIDGGIRGITGNKTTVTYNDATGLTGDETKDIFGSKADMYHWDDATQKDVNGRTLLSGHPLTGKEVHGQYRHLQIHPKGEQTVRVFYGEDLWEAERKKSGGKKKS